MLLNRIMPFILFLIVLIPAGCSDEKQILVQTGFQLDHNRMIVDAEIKTKDGSFRPIRLWVDTGNPDFFISRDLALAIGLLDPEDSVKIERGYIEFSPIPEISVGGIQLYYEDAKAYILNDRQWLLQASGADANLPSTVLRYYDVSFDYNKKKMELREKGQMHFEGKPVRAFISDSTGIVQIDGLCGKDSVSFAIDIGASYTFSSTEFLKSLEDQFPGIKTCTGTTGHSNIWGWNLHEEIWMITRAPQISFGDVFMKGLGMNVPPDFTQDGIGMMDYYSKKTKKPVDGFLGPNAFLNSKLGIDYANSIVYIYQKETAPVYDLDIAGISVRLESDGNYSVVGLTEQDGIPPAAEIRPGDLILSIDSIPVKGLTMGRVVDLLRGKPGEYRSVLVARRGSINKLRLKVERYL